MANKAIFWAVFFVAVFAIAYTATDLTLKYVMADFKVTETGYTTIEVKEVPTTYINGVVDSPEQHNQVYVEQPTVNPQLQ